MRIISNIVGAEPLISSGSLTRHAEIQQAQALETFKTKLAETRPGMVREHYVDRIRDLAETVAKVHGIPKERRDAYMEACSVAADMPELSGDRTLIALAAQEAVRQAQERLYGGCDL